MSTSRRDLILFLAGPGVIALAVAALFQVVAWPTLPRTGQAQALGLGATAICIGLGAIGAMLSTGVGCPTAPRLGDWSRWRRIVAWGLGGGFAYGAFDLGIYAWTPWGAHLTAIDHANGYTWANVALPWSVAHYLHGAIELESVYRLTLIVIPAWLICRLFLKGRFEAWIFWTFTALAALVEPLEKAIILRKLPLADMGPLDLAMNLEAIASQVLYALVLRRFGWPAPILMRYGYYLVVRVFGAYLFPYTSEMYPGQH
ncbi:MAG TPA: hypothetical protein VGH03_11390 [Caulobacteraceae bacterium]